MSLAEENASLRLQLSAAQQRIARLEWAYKTGEGFKDVFPLLVQNGHGLTCQPFFTLCRAFYYSEDIHAVTKEYLVTSAFNLPRTCLQVAAAAGSATRVALLLKCGADPNHAVPSTYSGDYVDPVTLPLYLAACGGHTACVELLLRAGARRYDRTYLRRTGGHHQLLSSPGWWRVPQDLLPFAHAAAKGHYLQCLDDEHFILTCNLGTPAALLAVQAALQHWRQDVNHTGSSATPLAAAAASGCLPMVQLLLQAGARPQAPAAGATAIHAACLSGSPEVLAALLAALQQQGGAAAVQAALCTPCGPLALHPGATPLMLAARSHSPHSMCALLLSHSAEAAGGAAGAVDASGATAMHHALCSSAGQAEVAAALGLLLQAAAEGLGGGAGGCQPALGAALSRPQQPHCLTPLRLARRRGQAHLAALLLAAGAVREQAECLAGCGLTLGSSGSGSGSGAVHYPGHLLGLWRAVQADLGARELPPVQLLSLHLQGFLQALEQRQGCSSSALRSTTLTCGAATYSLPLKLSLPLLLLPPFPPPPASEPPPPPVVHLVLFPQHAKLQYLRLFVDAKLLELQLPGREQAFRAYAYGQYRVEQEGWVETRTFHGPEAGGWGGDTSLSALSAHVHTRCSLPLEGCSVQLTSGMVGYSSTYTLGPALDALGQLCAAEPGVQFRAHIFSGGFDIPEEYDLRALLGGAPNLHISYLQYTNRNVMGCSWLPWGALGEWDGTAGSSRTQPID